MKKIDIQVNIKDFEDIRKLPGYQSAFEYPNIKELNPRCLGFNIVDDTTYFYLSGHNEDIIHQLCDLIFQLKLKTIGMSKQLSFGKMTVEEAAIEFEHFYKDMNSVLLIYKEYQKRKTTE